MASMANQTVLGLNIREKVVVTLNKDHRQCDPENSQRPGKCVEDYVDRMMGCRLPWKEKTREGKRTKCIQLNL